MNAVELNLLLTLDVDLTQRYSATGDGKLWQLVMPQKLGLNSLSIHSQKLRHFATVAVHYGTYLRVDRYLYKVAHVFFLITSYKSSIYSYTHWNLHILITKIELLEVYNY